MMCLCSEHNIHIYDMFVLWLYLLSCTCRQSLSQSYEEKSNDENHIHDDDDDAAEQDGQSLYSMKPDDFSCTDSVDSWDFSIESEKYRTNATSQPAVNHDQTPFARHDRNFFSSPANGNVDETLYANTNAATAQPSTTGSDHHRECTDALEDENSDNDSCGHFVILTDSMDEEEEDDKYDSDGVYQEPTKEVLLSSANVANEEEDEKEDDDKTHITQFDDVVDKKSPVSPPPDMAHMRKSQKYRSQRSLELLDSELAKKSVKSSSRDAPALTTTSSTSFLKQLLPLSIFQSNEDNKKTRVVYDFTEFVDDDDMASDDGMLTADVQFCSATDILTSLNMWAKEDDYDKHIYKYPNIVSNAVRRDTMLLEALDKEAAAQALMDQAEAEALEEEQNQLRITEEQNRLKKEVEISAQKEEQAQLQMTEEKYRLKKEAQRIAAMKDKARLAAMSKEDIIAEQVQRLMDVGMVTKQKAILEQRRVEVYRQTEFLNRQAQIDTVKHQVSKEVNRIGKNKAESEIIKKIYLNEFTERIGVTVLSMVTTTPKGTTVAADEYVDILLQHCLEHTVSSSLGMSHLQHNDRATTVTQPSHSAHINRQKLTDSYSEFASYTQQYQADEEDISIITAVESAPIKSRNHHHVNFSETNLIRPQDHQFSIPIISITNPILDFVSNVVGAAPPHVSIELLDSFIQYPEQFPLKMNMTFFVTLSAIGDVDPNNEMMLNFDSGDGDDWSDNLSKEEEFTSCIQDEPSTYHGLCEDDHDSSSCESLTLFENLDESSQEQFSSTTKPSNTSFVFSQESVGTIENSRLPMSSTIGGETASLSTGFNPDFFHDNDSVSAISDFKILYKEDESISVSVPPTVIPSSDLEEVYIEKEKQRKLKIKAISKINIGGSGHGNSGGVSVPVSEMSNSIISGNANLSIDLESHFSSYLTSAGGDATPPASIEPHIISLDGEGESHMTHDKIHEYDSDTGHYEHVEMISQDVAPDHEYQHQRAQLEQQHQHQQHYQQYQQYQQQVQQTQQSHSNSYDVHSLQDIFLENTEDRQYRGPQAYEGPGEYDLEHIYDDDEESLYDEDNYFNEELLDASASLVSNLTFDTALLWTDNTAGQKEEIFESEFGMILDAAEKERSSYLNDLDTQPLPLDVTRNDGNSYFEGSEIMDLYSIEEGDGDNFDDELSQRKGDEINLLLSDAILLRAREDDSAFRKQNRAHLRALRTVRLDLDNQSDVSSTATGLHTKKKVRKNYLESNKWVKNSACRKNNLDYNGIPDDIPGVTAVQSYEDEQAGEEGMGEEREPDEYMYLPQNHFYSNPCFLPNWDF